MLTQLFSFLGCFRLRRRGLLRRNVSFRAFSGQCENSLACMVDVIGSQWVKPKDDGERNAYRSVLPSDGELMITEENKMELGAFSVSLAVKDIEKSKVFYEKLGFSIFGGD